MRRTNPCPAGIRQLLTLAVHSAGEPLATDNGPSGLSCDASECELPPQQWIWGHGIMSASQDVEVKPSPIQGLGVFALRRFGAGDIIRRVNAVREVTEEQPLRPEIGELFEHCAYPEDRVVLYGFPDRHFNHSCDPNACEYYERGSAHIRARRAVRVSEEIALDYNMNLAGGEGWLCHCGAMPW